MTLIWGRNIFFSYLRFSVHPGMAILPNSARPAVKMTSMACRPDLKSQKARPSKMPITGTCSSTHTFKSLFVSDEASSHGARPMGPLPW
jgi:hypothetical protein